MKHFRRVEYYLHQHLKMREELLEMQVRLDALLPRVSRSFIKVGREVVAEQDKTAKYGILRAELAQEIRRKMEIYKAIEKARRSLDPVERQIFEYIYYDKLSPRTIQRQLGIKPELYYKFKNRIVARAWRYLRKTYAPGA